MNIEKKKVVGGTKLSSVAKATIATTFGMAPASLFIACGHPGGDFTIPEDDPINNPPTSSSTTESSNSDEFSSSSKYLDIPQSHEAISSEVLEALSSAAQPASSATTPSSSAANSSATQQASSSANAPTSAAQPLSSATQVSSSTTTPASSVNQTFSQSSEQSSSAAQPASSAAAPESSAAQPTSSAETQPANSSSSNGWSVYPQENPCEGVPDGTRIENGFQVIICPIPSSTPGSSSGFHGFSMVTTFELNDVMV